MARISLPDKMLRAIDEDAYSYLAQEDIARMSSYLEGIDEALDNGLTPEQLYQGVYQETGRNEIALRIKQAARQALRLRHEAVPVPQPTIERVVSRQPT